MKKNSFSLTAFLIAAAGILIIIYFLNNITGRTTNDTSSINLPENDTSFGGIFSSLYPEDSIHYSEFKKAQDSFNRIKQARDIKNKGLGMESFSSGGIGVFSARVKSSTDMPSYRYDPNNAIIKAIIDSLNKVYPHPSAKQSADVEEIINKKINAQFKEGTDSINRELEKEKLHYFGLGGYELKNYNTEFYISNNSYNLAFIKLDTVIKSISGMQRNGHYESKQIKVRYASERKTILIPITERTYKVLNFVLWAFAFFTGALILYFFFGLPIRLLINISKGHAFIERNIQMLNQISGFAFLIFFLTVITPYIFRLLFWNMIPDDFKMESLLNKIFDNLLMLIIALITFIIAKAFKKGYKLQYEQDLTI